MENGTPALLFPRQHIQDHDAAEAVKHHWGYADRVVPCVNDPGSCRYLDVVYGAHDVGMIYMGAFWATIAGILLIWAVVRRSLAPMSTLYRPPAVTGSQAEIGSKTSRESTVVRARKALWAYINRWLLPDFLRFVFGRTTRLQITVLAVITGYLTIFSFAGIVYGIWITPVAAHPGLYNIRSSLGPISDRVGVIAYALTPFSVLLASRESILSIITGIPYQNFNFLHRWLGYLIVVQSVVHTIGWSIIEIRLYQPQPEVAKKWIVQEYMIWGTVAMILLLMLYILSLAPVIRFTGYEFFRKSHWVLAMVYIGACIGHWEPLQCFLIPGILLWFFDRAARGVRTFLLHYNVVDGTKRRFLAAQAVITSFPDPEEGDVVRLDFDHPQQAWATGQHFYLCFTESSIWQSHPFTPLNAPVTINGLTKHSYIFRAKKGETKKVAEIAARKIAAASPDAKEANGSVVSADLVTTPVVLTGPYGDDISRNITPETNILCVAGGTGITYVLPVLLNVRVSSGSKRRAELLWVVRHARDVEWVKPELELLEEQGITVNVVATRDASSTSTLSDVDNEDGEKQTSVTVKANSGPTRHPELEFVVSEFIDRNVEGKTIAFASGPGGMMTDARAAVARCNEGSRVWAGEDRFSVDFYCDERLER